MPRAKRRIDESKLTKGELRKLAALRKSLGDKIADEAFAKWYDAQDAAAAVAGTDPNIEMLHDALTPLLDKISMPQGGAYVVRRGRRRFIIEAISLNS